MTPDELREQLQQCDPDRIEFHQHAHERARRRNIDIDGVREKVEAFDFVAVRDNDRSDSRFEHSYKATVSVDGDQYEMPLYFNVPSTKVLIKSIWPR